MSTKALSAAFCISGFRDISITKGGYTRQVAALISPWFSETGAGKVATLFGNCYDYYEQLSKVLSVTDFDSMKSAMEAAEGINFSWNENIITDKIVNGAVKGLKNATEDLNNWFKNYVDGNPVGMFGYDLCKFLCNIQCPVSVSIYDADGTQVGYVGDDDLWYDSDLLYIEHYGDAKRIYALADGLSIRAEGTDVGTLDCTVERYENGEPAERLNYYDIPLSVGSQIDLRFQAGSLTEGAVNVTAEGEPLDADEMLSIADYDNAVVKIICQLSNSKGGQVSGGGTYIRGDAVSLYAQEADGFIFLGWTNANGTLLSASRVYEFNAREDGEYIALFAEDVSDDAVIRSFFYGVADSSSESLLTSENATVNAEIYSLVSAVSFCAFYDEEGRFLGAKEEPLLVEAPSYIRFAPVSGASYAKLFILDENYSPICPSEQCDLA